MSEQQNSLITFAKISRSAAELLCDAVCDGCRSCVAQISDLNRRALSDLSDAERRFFNAPTKNISMLRAAHALGECVMRAFSAAMLLPENLPNLPPLTDIVTCNAQLAAFPEKLAGDTQGEPFPFYSMHLCANKSRGAHALLLTNYCANEGGRWLLPLSLALETHRNSLEHACGILTETVPFFDF